MGSLLPYVGLGAAALASALLIADYIRLRHNEYIDARAAKAAVALLGGARPAKCTERDSCNAPPSKACTDGRCRHHCRLSCDCPGNRA